MNNTISPYMLPDQVHAQSLDDLEVIDHCFVGRWGVDAIWPVALVERAEEEDKLAVQQRSLDSIHYPGRDGTEARVTFDPVRTHGHNDVVQGR